MDEEPAMKWLNYNHLYYFWMAAREGSVTRASEELMISQPTVSSQIKELEGVLGRALFERRGRKLVLTDTGRVAYNYASEIFSLGRQLMEAVEHQSSATLRLTVGIVDSIPKTVARILLEPALGLSQPVRLITREDKSDRLLADLAARRLDIVLSDSPIASGAHLQGFNHLLGESGITFFAATAVASKLTGKFPKNLENAPMLLPTDNTAMRRSLDLWLEARRIHPAVVAEFDDTAMLTSFGQAGLGVFPAPTVVADEIRRLYRVRVIGQTDAIRERFYAISTEQKLKHPAVLAIRDAARREIFQ